MGIPSRRFSRFASFWSACLLIGIIAPAIQAQSLTLSRLDADPPAARVIAGEYDREFIRTELPRIVEREPGVHWWRVITDGQIPSQGMPQLLLMSPRFNHAEIWLPGMALPLRRGFMGKDANLDHSTRALVVPLNNGLEAGQAVYVRVDARTTQAMPVSVESLAQVHRNDLRHVAWRTAIIVTFSVLIFLSLGFWIGIGQRSYAYLLLTLFAQLLYQLNIGGEMRALPWLAEGFGGDIRAGRFLAMASAIASISFIAFYLDLAKKQPSILRIVHGCNAVMALLLVANMASDAGLVSVLANMVVLLAAVVVLVACVIGTWRGQRAASFLLVSLLPAVALVTLSIGESFGLWINPAWMAYAVPAGLAFAGLMLTVGLADSMQKLRRDRDRASRLATFDALTGAMSRPATEERLRTAVADSHRSGLPLSVVFFDIDNFKRVNDDFGHRAGDECLRIIASRTRNRLRRYDQCGRYGGDEMLVILPDTHLDEARGVAENLRSSINCRPLSIDGRLLDATLSLGIAQLAPGETPEQLLERADAALYASKAAGRDRVSGHVPGTITQELKAYSEA
jgi:diguanylate cyclase (GGDEF)-like protein